MVLSITVVESDTLTIESGPLASEDKPLSCGTNSGKEQGISFYHILKLNLTPGILLFFFLNKITCDKKGHYSGVKILNY